MYMALPERGLSPYPQDLKDINMSPLIIAIGHGELNVLKQLKQDSLII